MKNLIKRGTRYVNHLGEYAIIASVYRNIIKVRICGERARIETWKKEDFQRQDDRFWILPFPRTNRTNVARHLLEYQLNMIGKTTSDTDFEPNWFNTWTITDQEYEFFEKYALSLIRKIFKCNKQKALNTLEWFNMQFGLKRKNS